MYLVTESLTSPESALFLNDIYDKEFIKPMRNIEEYVFGAVLKRDEESVEPYTSIDSTLDEYIYFDIKKIFNLSIIEYMNLSLYEKNKLLYKAKDNIEKMDRMLQDINGDVKNKKRKLSDDGLDDILGE